MRGRYERAKPQKKGGKTALIIVCILIGLIAAGLIFGVIFYNSTLNKINRAELVDKQPDASDLAALIPPTEASEETETTEAPTTETTIPETKPMTAEDIVNILVVGQSARPGEPGYMADSTILVSINKYTKTVTLSSVLRDAFVKFPTFKGPDGKMHSGGRVKFTSVYAAAYMIGDIACAMDVANLTMSDNFGVNVDYNFEINMEMFTRFIDALGTVELELTQAEADYLNKDLKGYCEVSEGMTSLDGYMALSYARMRKAEGDADSDIKRTARQRYLVERILSKVKYKMRTEGIGAIQELTDAVLPYVTTNMTNSEITQLMMDVLPILPELKIESGTCPVEGKKSRWGDMVDIYKDGFQHSVIRFDEGLNKKAMRFISEGEGEYPDTGK